MIVVKQRNIEKYYILYSYVIDRRRERERKGRKKREEKEREIASCDSSKQKRSSMSKKNLG